MGGRARGDSRVHPVHPGGPVSSRAGYVRMFDCEFRPVGRRALRNDDQVGLKARAILLTTLSPCDRKVVYFVLITSMYPPRSWIRSCAMS